MMEIVINLLLYYLTKKCKLTSSKIHLNGDKELIKPIKPDIHVELAIPEWTVNIGSENNKDAITVIKAVIINHAKNCLLMTDVTTKMKRD